MWTPTCYGDPGKVTDAEYLCTTFDNGGVHINSGIPNHAFALMVDGGEYNGVTVPAIGLTKATHIHWRTMSTYLAPASDFVDQADGLEASCQDLIGIDLFTPTTEDTGWGVASGEVIAQADCDAVAAAIAAVEFRTPPSQCNFVPFFEDGPALCQDLGSVQSSLFENFESGNLPAGWSVGEREIVNPETFDNPNWDVVGSLPSGRSGSAAFVSDTVNLGNCQADIEAGVQYLQSPMVEIPEGVNVPRMSFTHLFGIELGLGWR